MGNRQNQMNIKLADILMKYNEIILLNKSDPYIELMSYKTKKVVVGPKDSNLIAMVKIKSSGHGGYYRRYANKIINDKMIINEIVQNFCSDGDSFIVDMKNSKNPYFIRKDGEIVKLDWHHSPNHIMSVSLIPKSIHNMVKVKKELHYDGKRGGNDMYNIYK